MKRVKPPSHVLVEQDPERPLQPVELLRRDGGEHPVECLDERKV